MTSKIYHQKDMGRQFRENKKTYNIIANFEISQIGDQSPYFSVTAEIWEKDHSKEKTGSFGCQHEEVIKNFPDYEKFIKWHLTSLEQPMHYLANSLYWAGFQGYCNGNKNDPPNLEHLKSTCIFGALQSDNDFDIEYYLFNSNDDKDTNTEKKGILTNWLNDRLPALMNQFYVEMKELFPAFELITN